MMLKQKQLHMAQQIILNGMSALWCLFNTDTIAVEGPVSEPRYLGSQGCSA